MRTAGYSAREPANQLHTIRAGHDDIDDTRSVGWLRSWISAASASGAVWTGHRVTFGVRA